MTLRIPKNPLPSVECDTISERYATDFPVGATIMISDTDVVENPSEIIRITIPEEVEFIQGNAFKDFVNLKEAVIDGDVYEVNECNKLDGVVVSNLDFKDSTTLAEALKRGNPIKIQRSMPRELRLEKLKERLEKLRSNVILFESDDEFADFCIAPYAIVKRSERGYHEGEFSEMYLKAIEEGKKFVIKDEDSKVYKSSSVSGRVLAKSELDGELYISDRTCHVQLDLDRDNFIDYFEYNWEEKMYLKKIKELEE